VAIETDQLSTERSVFREDFSTFYAREVRSVVGLAYILSGSRSGAEDLAQDAFLAAFRDWEKVGSFDSPGAWVRRVVSRRSVSFLRRRAAAAKALFRLRGESVVVPELTAESDHIWRAVRSLPKRQAQSIALRFVDGRSINEIAEILDCSENTVKTHLRRAKDTLARRLREER